MVPGDNGIIEHAQLTLGNGIIVLGSVRDNEDESVKVSAEVGFATHGVYLVVDDIDAHCLRAKAAGAVVIMEIADQDYGGRLSAARDPEGHL